MISLIFAISQNNVIGINNKMPWDLPDDLKRFRDLTKNHTIIMGRKTFLSLPKVLPNRHHIVCTRDENFTIDNPNVTMSYDFHALMEKYKNSEEEVFIIGGGEIYETAFPYCTKVYVTEIYKDFSGDTLLNLNYDDFNLEYESEMQIDEKSNIKFKFLNYILKKS